MSVGHGMFWPLAAEYARRGWAVRRAGWAGEVTDPFDKDTSMRWIVHHHGLFHLTYLSKSLTETGAVVSRVVRNDDFGVEEFLARDWTVYSPQCGTVYEGWDQQGKMQYPTPIDIAPPSYPFNPPSGETNPPAECPVVPPIHPPVDHDDCDVPCGDPPNCGSNFKLAIGGFDTCGCRIHLCQPVFCGNPPSCFEGFTPRVIGFNDLGCAVWYCAPDDRQPCAAPPDCGPDAKLAVTGIDARGCPIHACQPVFCIDPPSCPPGETAISTGTDETGCVIWDCVPDVPPCGNPPDCGPNSKLMVTGQDATGCPTYACVPADCGDPTSTRTFLVVVENDVNRGDEGVPDSAEPAYPAPALIELKSGKGAADGYAPLDEAGKLPVAHLPGGILIDPSITALTGGGANSLAAIISGPLPLDRVLGVVVGGALSFYQLKSGTAATASPGIIRPNDYDAANNARFWSQIL